MNIIDFYNKNYIIYTIEIYLANNNPIWQPHNNRICAPEHYLEKCG